MQNNDQYCLQNESSNSKDDQRSNPSPGSKRKKPMPPLIPIKMASSSSTMHNAQKSDSDENQSSCGEDGELKQYKIITSLLSKPELSVESVMKSSGGGSHADNLANLKKKSSFFDVLRKKLIEGNVTGSEDKNLVCKCAYEAKTLSDLIIHQKTCGRQDSILQSLALGSTRCQFCRVRFKKSQDLFSHMRKCPSAQAMIELESSSEANGDEKMTGMEDYMSDEAAIDNPNERHPMENRVFVWNQLAKSKKEPSDTSDRNDDSDDNNLVVNEDDDLPETPTLTDSEYLGVESAPGYGEITKKVEAGDEITHTAMKKVRKILRIFIFIKIVSR